MKVWLAATTTGRGLSSAQMPASLFLSWDAAWSQIKTLLAPCWTRAPHVSIRGCQKERAVGSAMSLVPPRNACQKVSIHISCVSGGCWNLWISFAGALVLCPGDLEFEVTHVLFAFSLLSFPATQIQCEQLFDPNECLASAGCTYNTSCGFCPESGCPPVKECKDMTTAECYDNEARCGEEEQGSST